MEANLEQEPTDIFLIDEKDFDKYYTFKNFGDSVFKTALTNGCKDGLINEAEKRLAMVMHYDLFAYADPKELIRIEETWLNLHTNPLAANDRNRVMEIFEMIMGNAYIPFVKMRLQRKMNAITEEEKRIATVENITENILICVAIYEKIDVNYLKHLKKVAEIKEQELKRRK